MDGCQRALAKLDYNKLKKLSQGFKFLVDFYLYILKNLIKTNEEFLFICSVWIHIPSQRTDYKYYIYVGWFMSIKAIKL